MTVIQLNEIIARLLKRLGKCIARNPVLFLLASITLSAVLSTGMLFAKYEADFHKLQQIRGSKLQENEKLISSLFPINTSVNFDVLRSPNPYNGVFVLFLNKNRRGLFNESVFNDIQLVDDIVRNISIRDAGSTIKYSDICAKKDNACYENPILKLRPDIKSIIARKYRIKYPLNVNKLNSIPSLYSVNMGGVIVDVDGYVEDVLAIRLMYFVDFNDIQKIKYIKKWQTSVGDELEKRNFGSVDVYSIVLFETEEAVQEVADGLLPVIGVVGSIMILFSVFTFMTNSWIRSKPWLGIAAGTSAGLAIGASFGFTSFIGVPFNYANSVIPFLVLGTEIDDAFVLVASWRATNPEDDIETRMGETFSKAAVSITVTSLTSFLAYCIGISSSVALIEYACAHIAVCIFFTYFYQLIFFGSCLALDGRREKAGRNAVTFRLNNGEEERSKIQEEIVTKWIRNYFGGFIAIPFVKLMCLGAFILNLAFGIYGIFHLEVGTDLNHILFPGSRIAQSFQVQYKYFTAYALRLHIIINKPLNYADRTVQISVEEMLNEFEKHPHIADNQLTISWLKYYKKFANHSLAKFSLSGYNLSEKQDFIDGLRNVFLKIELAKQFQYDLNFNDNFTEITSCRFILILKNINNFEIEKRLTSDIYEITKNSKIPINIFSILFRKSEEGVVIGKISMQCIWLTTLIITIVFYAFVRRFLHVILVSICVVSSMTETIGYMALWDVRLGIPTTIALILCLGFSINYPTHFSYAFITSKSYSGEERMKEALQKVGLPIIQGSITTFTAVIILALQQVEVFTSAFKIILLIVFESAFHSLFFLPTVLTLVSNLISKDDYAGEDRKTAIRFLRSRKESTKGLSE